MDELKRPEDLLRECTWKELEGRTTPQFQKCSPDHFSSKPEDRTPQPGLHCHVKHFDELCVYLDASLVRGRVEELRKEYSAHCCFEVAGPR